MGVSDNKRLATNTVVLYVKLIISITVSIVISRLVLDALGASDYGLYNVVGGIVTMLNTLGVSMVSTSYRYMAVELGKGDAGNPNRVYNTILVIHLCLAAFLLIVGETLGVYYVNHILNVEVGKVSDALFVLHLSLLTTAFAVITVPMNGLIIAREKFVFTSIVETVCVLLKLLLVILLLNMEGNRLRIYASFLAIIQFISPLSYQLYCRIKEGAIVKWRFNKDKSDYKGISGFASWILLGALAVLGKTQGAAMIINYFFGTVLNAAFGLAAQVNHAVSQFTSTLRQAAIPQIMKNQSAGNEERSLKLVYYISKYSYLFMNIMAIPLLLCIEDVLHIWLGDNIPEYTTVFIVFMLINGMVSNLGAGFDASIQATGKIKKNQIGYSVINLALLPIMFVLYKIGLPPYVNVIVMLCLTVITLVFQIYIMVGLTSFSMVEYLKFTFLPSFSSTTMSFIPLFFLRPLFHHDIVDTLLFIAVAVLWTCISIYIAGMNRSEKQLIASSINKMIHKN